MGKFIVEKMLRAYYALLQGGVSLSAPCGKATSLPLGYIRQAGAEAETKS